MLEGVDDPLWFAAYSHTLQWVGEVSHRERWEWPVGKMPEVRVSPLVHALPVSNSARSCPRGVYSEGGRGAR